MGWWRWTVAGSLAAGLAVVLLTVNGTGAATLAAHPARPPAPTLADAADRPADGELRVTEQGFSQRDQTTERTLTPGYGPGRPEPYKPVYAAFTLSNSSTRDTALLPAVKVTYRDAAGRAVPASVNAVYAGSVPPGASATFAAFLSVTGVRVVRMTVELTGARWLPAAAVPAAAAPLTARDVKLLPTTVPGVATVTWTAVSATAEPVLANGFVVYRDRTGRLLGAEHDTIGTSDLLVPPGESTGSVTFRPWYPPGTDLKRLSVTLRAGYRVG